MEEPESEDGAGVGDSGFGVDVAGVVVFGASDDGAAELGLLEGLDVA